MYAVERLGSYITRGVYTVSGSFHPFGGAVDIIVVEQPDGSFKSSPWYVRFGKFQGVLKAREKVVTITVNGVEANFHMFLDPRGEASFLREVEGGEGESALYPSSSSDDETDEQSQKSQRPLKSKSCDHDGSQIDSGDQIDASNGEIMACKSRTTGVIFGGGPIKVDGSQDKDDSMVRISPSERAEIASNLVETLMLNESNLEEKLVDISEISRSINEPILQDADLDNGAHAVISEVTCSVPQIADIGEACHGKLNEEQTSDGRNVGLLGFGVSEEESESGRVESIVYCETSESSIMGLHGMKEQSGETTYLASGGAGEGHSCAETLQVTPDPLAEDIVNLQAEDIEMEREQIESRDIYPQQTYPSSSPMSCNDEANLEAPLTGTTSYTEIVCVKPVLGLAEVRSKGISFLSSFSNPIDQSQDESIEYKITSSEVQTSVELVGDSEQLNGNCSATKATMISVSESLEEEQFFFSDIDEFEDSELRETLGKSSFPDAVDKEDQLPSFPEGINIMSGPLNTIDESYSSSDNFAQKNGFHDFEKLTENSKSTSSPIHIPKHQSIASAEVGRLAESLPDLWSNIHDLGTENLHEPLSHSLDLNSESLEWELHGQSDANWTKSDTGNEDQSAQDYSNKEDTHDLEDVKYVGNTTVEISLSKHLLYEGMGAEAASQAFDAEKLDLDKFTALGPEVVKSDKLVVRIGGRYFPWDAAAPIVLGMVAFGSKNVFEPKDMIPVDQVEKSLVGDPSKAIVSTGGSWRLWPFPFRKSRSRKAIQPALNDTRSSDAVSVLDSNICMDDRNLLNGKASKKVLKAIAPTSEELASLDLKEGSNAVTFTFSTAMLGRQKVDARIYLWKWNTRIVISDVDGTITKSDVLGQFMPLVGIDWSQTGVAHLFSAIKDNGYQFLYLSARAIAQAYITRNFLVNLKQDGKALPDGPVVISPDGLFPSLFREVIRRVPHEFKIACLEDIRKLFPSDCNPFYAGFGNRDTDEISYLKVGIPLGKIFIINPKGEVAVNRLVDTRSYTSLHALVHGMFPAMTSSEQEDFNSWNFWKLPPPDIDF